MQEGLDQLGGRRDVSAVSRLDLGEEFARARGLGWRSPVDHAAQIAGQVVQRGVITGTAGLIHSHYAALPDSPQGQSIMPYIAEDGAIEVADGGSGGRKGQGRAVEFVCQSAQSMFQEAPGPSSQSVSTPVPKKITGSPSRAFS